MGIFDREREHGEWCDCTRCEINKHYTMGGEPPMPSWMQPDLCVRCQDYPKMSGYDLCGHCYWAVQAEVNEGLGQLQAFVDKYIGWSVFQAHNGLVT